MLGSVCVFFFFQAEDGIRDAQESRGLGDVYKRQYQRRVRGRVRAMSSSQLVVTAVACLTLGALFSVAFQSRTGADADRFLMLEHQIALMKNGASTSVQNAEVAPDNPVPSQKLKRAGPTSTPQDPKLIAENAALKQELEDARHEIRMSRESSGASTQSWFVKKGQLHTIVAVSGAFAEDGSLKLPTGTNEIWLDIGINAWKTAPKAIKKDFPYMDSPAGQGVFYIGFEPLVEKWAYHVGAAVKGSDFVPLGGLQLGREGCGSVPPVKGVARGTMFPMAVGNFKNQMAEFHVSSIDGCSSLNQQRSTEDLASKGWSTTETGNAVNKGCGNTKELRRVPTISLESILTGWLRGREVEFAHIDVQGAELSVLQSAGASIKQLRRFMIEVPNPDCATLTKGAPSCEEIFSELGVLGFEPEDGVHWNGSRPWKLKRGFSCSAVPWKAWNSQCEFDILFVRKDIK
eukprot:TRINITY_DN22780_c0_g2_i3.p1 TRINITY_DN22780_c0_g2~~TRINITY_DN22780_c0_g2_i3.p1  ORF type:complete len:460 (+),score=84.18 TRINITY_DN22780_c0_g2_i3:51-1430(+)